MNDVQVYAVEISDNFAEAVPLLLERLRLLSQADSSVQEKVGELACEIVGGRRSMNNSEAHFVIARGSQSFVQSSYSKSDLQIIRNYMQESWKNSLMEYCELIGLPAYEPVWMNLEIEKKVS